VRNHCGLTESFIAVCLTASSQLVAAQEAISNCAKARPYLASAQSALSATDSATVLEELNRAVEIDPNCPDAHLLLGLTEFQRGDTAKSILHYRKAIKLSPRSYSAHYDVALAYLKEKKLQLARAELEQAVALDPKQANAVYDLGVVLLELGQPAAALIHLHRAHAMTPGRPDVSFNIIRAELEAGRLNDARQSAQQVASQWSSDFQWNAAVGQAFLKHGLPKDALPYLRAANLLRPSEEAMRNELATAYLASRQPDGVLDLIGEPKTADEHYLRGMAFYQAHRFSEADQESDGALALAPQDPRALVLRVRVLQRAGQQEAAAAMAEKASALAPDWDEPFYLAGVSYYFLRHYAEARQSLARAFELNPKLATAIFMEALASAKDGNLTDAKRLLRQAITLQPSNARLHCHLGIILMRENDYAKAQESFKIAARLKSDYALPHYGLGKLSVYSQQWKEARDEFEAAITAEPRLTSAYYQLARVYAKLGEKEKSESVLAAFKRLHSQEIDDAAAAEEDARSESSLQ